MLYLDTVEPLFELPYLGDLNIAIFIIKLLCGKFNTVLVNPYRYDDYTNINLRYYLQHRIYQDINYDLDIYEDRMNNELINLTNIFNIKHKYNNISFDVAKDDIDVNNWIFNMPTYDNRNYLSNYCLKNISYKEIEGLSQLFAWTLWTTNFEDNLMINENYNKEYYYVAQGIYDMNYKLGNLYNKCHQEIKDIYNIEKYYKLKEKLFERLSIFHTKNAVNELINSLVDINKLKLNECFIIKNL